MLTAKRNRPGENIDYLNTGVEALREGEVIALGEDRIGIVGATIEPNEVGAVWVEGVWIFPKAPGALSIGDSVSWTDGTGIAATGDTPVGWVVQPAAAGDATVLVKLG